MANINSSSQVNEQQFVPTIANPAAGADWSYTVPAGYSLQWESLRLTLTTDATVANRMVRIKITRGSTIIGSFMASAVTAANIILTITFEKGIPVNTVSTTSTLGVMPTLPPLLPGDVIATFILNLQPGDAITIIVPLFCVV